jgi:hypothetical protein
MRKIRPHKNRYFAKNKCILDKSLKNAKEKAEISISNKKIIENQ